VHCERVAHHRIDWKHKESRAETSLPLAQRAGLLPILDTIEVFPCRARRTRVCFVTKKKNARREPSPKNGSRAGEAAETRPKLADEPREEKPEPLTIVGIGASAGGLAALKTFFEHVPADSGLAYVVVVHLSPKYESHLAELLQPHVHMPVRQVAETVSLEPNQVYVIPPNANLDTIDTHLRVTQLEPRRQERAPIDHFFRTLASTHDGKAIGVILTGSGSDGTLGLREIKERGGLTIVQDPTEAEYDGMPQSAVATGLVDLVLPLAQIPRAIVDFACTKPDVIEPGDEERIEAETNRLLQKVFAQLRARTSRDFSRYKRSTIMRRIQRRMQIRHIEKFDAYLELLRGDADEVCSLGDDLLVTVTNFFRDPQVFEFLQTDIVPKLFEGRAPEESIRVWSVGCATGEEPYSLAILLLEEAGRRDASHRIQIFASDLHEASLEKAREGFYPGDIQTDVSPERLGKFFHKEDGGYRVRKEVRELVVFAPHNIMGDPPFSRVDLLSCRNLMIYLQRDVQRQVIELFHYALRPGGFLLLGASEAAEASDLFQLEDKKSCIYRKCDMPTPEVRLPVFPAPRTQMSENHRRSPPTGEPIAYGLLHQRLLEQYAPPSLLISPDDAIVHVSEHAGRYCVVPGGELTSSALKLVRQELRAELRAALYFVREKCQPFVTKPILVRFNGESGLVVLHVRPASTPPHQGYALAIFDEQTAETTAEKPAEPSVVTPHEQFETLESELRESRQRLQCTIEEYETSQEELRASNEELQSANEELHATLEELETSKEELQSINEELQTVNQENRHKVAELAALSSDLQNLMAATDIATLFLDRDLRIVRFTPQISELFNVRVTDRGRPLSDLTHRLGYDDLETDSKRVLNRLTPIVREVQDEGGRWYLTRILPYRSTSDHIEGVVLTFIDITERKNSEEALRRSEAFHRLAVEAGRVGTWEFDLEKDECTLSPIMSELMGYPPEQRMVSGKRWRESVFPEDRPRVEAAFQSSVQARTPFEVIFCIQLSEDGLRWLYSRGDVSRQEAGKAARMHGASIDLTDRRHAEQALRASEEQLREANEALERRVNERTNDLQQTARHLRSLTAQLTRAEQMERRRIANVLHDHVQQILVAARLRVETLRDQASSKADQRALNDVGRMLDDAVAAARSLSVELAPPLLHDEGLPAALDWLASQMKMIHRLNVRVNAQPEANPQREEDRDFLFHAARELLLNVVKHAKTDRASVRLVGNETGCTLEVADEGIGFQVDRVDRNSFGLFHLRERVAALGGALEIESSQRGTRVIITLPSGSGTQDPPETALPRALQAPNRADN
jgi:two-component system, chemotaxis family, CheB/CheR fusion protein